MHVSDSLCLEASLLQEKGSLPQLKVLVNFAAKVDPDKCTV